MSRHPTPTDPERNRFEEWYEADAMPLESDWFKLDNDGDYEFGDTRTAWNAWRARAALEASLPQWLPISTAPKDGTEILIACREGIVIGWWETGREFPNSPHFNDWSNGPVEVPGYDAGFKRLRYATHWLPLPPPPRAEGEG